MKEFSINFGRLKYSKRLVPELYYYTEVLKQKLIADGLQYDKVGDVCEVSDGEHSAIPRNNRGGVRYLYGRNVKEGVIDFDPISDDSFIDEDDYKHFKRCHVKENDVLIAIYGTVGKSALYKQEYTGLAGIPRHISNISVGSNAHFSPEYLSAFFRSKIGKHQIFSVVTGNIQQLFSLMNIRDFDVPILPLDLMKSVTALEQKAMQYEINAKKVIDAAKQLIYANLGFDIKKVKRDKSFSVKSCLLRNSNYWSASFYDKLYENTEIELKKNCNVVEIGKIANCTNGIEVGSDNYNEYIFRDCSDVPFIRTSDIVCNEVDLYPDYYVPRNILKNDPKLSNYSICERDVLFSKDGKIGCTGMISSEDDVVVSSGIEILRINDIGEMLGLTPEYLFATLSIPEIGLYAAKKRTVIASTIPHLRESRLKEIGIPILDESTIKEVTELVKKAYVEKAKRKKAIKKIDGMIEGWFKEKLDEN